jgi:hypothetical protein
MLTPAEHREAEERLLRKMKENLTALEELLTHVNGHWQYEDLVYRFYHHSFKVYVVQSLTQSIVTALQELRPDVPLNEDFLEIVRDGTGKTFAPDVNRAWTSSTRAMIEAFFHARYFLDMVVRYARELEEPPTMLPSGWAAVLYLYGLR